MRICGPTMLSGERMDSNVAESSSRRAAPLDVQVAPSTASLEAVFTLGPMLRPQDQQNRDAGRSNDDSSGQMYNSRRS